MTNQISEQSWANIVARFDGMAAQADDAVAVARNAMSVLRAEMGHVRFTPNQVMAPNIDNTGVEGLVHSGATLDVQIAGQFIQGSGVANGYPDIVAQEMAESVGFNYVNHPFNILRVTWSGVTGKARFHDSWMDGKSQGRFTEAAYIKLVAGELGGTFAEREAYANGWGLWGRTNTDMFGHGHDGLNLQSSNGEMLIALYAKATGHADLNNGEWGLFPSIV